MTAALEGSEWSAARPGRNLPPGKTIYPFYRRLGRPQGRSGRSENLVPTGIRSRTVQPVAQSLYRLSNPWIFSYPLMKSDWTNILRALEINQEYNNLFSHHEWSTARPGRTLPPGKTGYPFYRRLGGSQGRSGRAEYLVPTWIRSRTVQPLASRYTDWATRPKFQKCMKWNYKIGYKLLYGLIIIILPCLCCRWEYNSSSRSSRFSWLLPLW